MTRRRKNREQAVAPESAALTDFWEEQIRIHGRRLFFVDTGGILKALERDETFVDFFDSIVGEQLITSTYVLAEVVRRIVKSDNPGRFIGPSGERGTTLAVYVLTAWIQSNRVRVICPPEQVFHAAKNEFVRNQGIGCDLVDVISFVIVVGLQQNRIVSADRHFRSLGLVCYPG